MCERVGMSDRKINRERKREVLRVTNFANEDEWCSCVFV